MVSTLKVDALDGERDEDTDPSVVCPDVDTDPFSENFEYTGSTTPAGDE
jgi:hypothetical protein